MVSVIVVCGISSMVAASLHLFLSPSVSTHSAACQQKRQEDDAARKQCCKTTTLKLEQKLEEMETKDEEKLAALYKALGGISDFQVGTRGFSHLHLSTNATKKSLVQSCKFFLIFCLHLLQFLFKL